METARDKATNIIGIEGLFDLETAGLTVVPVALVDRLRDCDSEEVLHVGDKAVVIAPASDSDVERISYGFIMDRGD